MGQLNKSKDLPACHSRRIDLDGNTDCAMWAETLGVSTEELRAAVRKVGPFVEDLEAFFRGGQCGV
jgi:hypothetical protein